jgi:soluble lytic murein transglycosylase-like protein
MDTNEQTEQQHTTRPRRQRSVVFTGKNIWVSELASTALVGALLVALLSVSLVILKNEFTIQRQNYDIAAMKAERVNIVHAIAVMQEKERLVKLLNEVAGQKITPEARYRLAELIHQNSTQYGYSPELLLAVIAVESRFNPQAMGRYRGGTLSGAIGIMQIKYETASHIAKTLDMGKITRQDLLDPEINMVLGTAYLVTLITQFKNFKHGILAYNLGPSKVRLALANKEPLPMRYYEKVLKQYYRIKEIENN